MIILRTLLIRFVAVLTLMSCESASTHDVHRDAAVDQGAVHDAAIDDDAAAGTDVSVPRDAPGQDTGRDASSTFPYGVVATYHDLSTEAGLEILRGGGNAFDAFIAATLVDYVVSAGVTSPAGIIGAMVYVSRDESLLYLDGDFNETLAPVRDGTTGGAVVVPGAIPALGALSERLGALPWSEVVQPAIRAARDGFVVDRFFAGTVAQYSGVLSRSEYGRNAYLNDGVAPAVGTTLALPELADFLETLAELGASHMQTGAWADAAVAAVQETDGSLAPEDLASYRPAWRESRSTMYREHEVHAPSGRAYGGLWALVALEVLEHASSEDIADYPNDADALERMLRVTRATHSVPMFFETTTLDDPERVDALLAPAFIGSLVGRVDAEILAGRGSHSYHIVVSDAAGNIVTGTNTIVGPPFGEGIFVEGVPLTAGGAIAGYRTSPGERRISPLSNHIVLHEGRPVAAMGAFGTSLIEVELEMLVDTIDAHLSGAGVASRPHFGTFPYDWDTGEVDVGANWIDSRVPESVRTTVESRGLRLVVEPTADTGFGVALTLGAEPSAGALQTYGHPVSVGTYP